MLAKQDWHHPPCDPVPLKDYSGFPLWEAFLAEPNREEKSAFILDEKLNLTVYWPHYTVQNCRPRSRVQSARFRSVLPCILLAPVETLDHPRRDDILEWARLKPLRSYGRLLTKAEVEIIREIEARLNIRVNGYEVLPTFQIGQRVRFRNDTYVAFLGNATVLEVASGHRISIKMDCKLFGGKDVIWTTAAELEAI